MECFQSMLLDPDGQVRFESVNVCRETRTTPDGTEVWSGYFEPPTVSGLISGRVFRLVLNDGGLRTSRSSTWRPSRLMPPRADPVRWSAALTLAGRREGASAPIESGTSPYLTGTRWLNGRGLLQREVRRRRDDRTFSARRRPHPPPGHGKARRWTSSCSTHCCANSTAPPRTSAPSS